MAGNQSSIPRSCENCRTAHAKCDPQLPSCSRCLEIGSECVRAPQFSFRHTNIASDELYPKSEFGFASDQKWISIPKHLEFVSENFLSENQDDEPADLAETPPNSSGASAQQSPAFLSPISYLGQMSGSDLQQLTASSTHEPIHEEYPQVTNDWIHTTEPGCYELKNSTRNIPHEPGSIVINPLLDEASEVILLRHFITTLSAWFDYCDPQNTFATLVVQRAITSPPLRFAILATSAQHLSAIDPEYDGLSAEIYHRKCLDLLIPMLNASDAALDDALYAATVVLRVYEEISVSAMGRDSESHLMGTHTFARAQKYHQQTAIQKAVFRVVIRQEIVHTFRNQRPVQLLQNYIQAGKSLEQHDDSYFAFQTFVLCAEVLTMCYGEGLRTPEAWEELESRVQTWMDSQPITFEPLMRREPSQSGGRNVFPEIWLLNDSHVAVHTHYLLCRILLVAHDPRKPQLGPRRAEAVETSNRIIRNHVRSVCGIALSNSHCIPSMFTACIIIGICGDLFSDYREQKAMFDILVHTESKLAWPTGDMQDYLRQTWGWDA